MVDLKVVTYKLKHLFSVAQILLVNFTFYPAISNAVKLIKRSEWAYLIICGASILLGFSQCSKSTPKEITGALLSNFSFRIPAPAWVLSAVVVLVEGEEEFLLDKDTEGRNKNSSFHLL